jgi:hypothetical protein
MLTFATVCRAFTVVRIGSFMTPDASARRFRSAIAAVAAGEVTSAAFTTAVAGEGEPGNACSIRS